jgi:asparagine synthase (glutamine-hydrolysing)
MTASLFHRGPDQQGVFESGDVSLGAVRLKIIDLAGGDQPIISEDGNTVIAFNGEVYNFAVLRRELEGLGHQFQSNCDTEVVLHAFLEWNTDCFARLRGMFAVALWSEAEKRLVLARDRLGIKPLYYYRRGQDIWFGSELKAILEDPDVPRALDMDALEHYLCLNYVPSPFTLVKGIEKLPPGHFLEWRNGAVTIEPWWKLEFHPRAWSFGDAKQELDRLLREAVGEHLVSDVPLGIWASGGLDSSAILHYAAEASPRRLKTFSVSFAGRSFDESRYFREISRLYGTDHYEFDLSPDLDLESAIEDFAWYSDEPGADAGALPVWFLSRMSRQHVTVALSGEGADELFGGYLTYVADHLTRSVRLVPAPARRALLDALRRYWPVSDDKISLEYMLKRGIEGSCLGPDEAHFFWNGTFTAAQRKRLCPASNGNNVRSLFNRLPAHAGIGHLNRYLLADQYYYLPDDILYKCDRMSMAHSLEVRPPFLDHRIVEFAASLPQNFKVRGVTTKRLLKEVMRGKLPDFVIDRKKTGFDIPAHDWFRTVLRGLLLDTLSPQAIAAAGIFDARAIQDLIRDHMERRINAGYHLWGLVTLFLWMKKWRIETPADERSAQRTPELAIN